MTKPKAVKRRRDEAKTGQLHRHVPKGWTMPLLPEEAACVSHRHREWWSADVGTLDGLEMARAAAVICVLDCPSRVFDICDQLARDLRPNVGVFAGRAWIHAAGNTQGRPSDRDLL